MTSSVLIELFLLRGLCVRAPNAF